MPCVVSASCDPRPHFLRVELDANPNSLLRLLEPFVVANVLPYRLASAVAGEDLIVHLAFHADDDLAGRLIRRLEAMVPVRQVCILPGADVTALSAAA